MRPLLMALFALVFSCTTLVAVADDAPSPLPQPSGSGSNAVGACLAADEVWLFVVDVDGTVLANQCVGTPGDGEEALREAGAVIGYGKKGLICTIDKRPERCPTNFDGSFWNYYHGLPGQEWVFSNLGATSHTPQPGSIEAWCYNEPDDSRCTPPHLRVVIDDALVLPPGVTEADVVDPAPVVRAPVPPPPPMPIATLLSIVVVLALLGVLLVVARRRRSTSHAGIPIR